ncbi:family 43 glycosylhydrolase [Microbacterium sp. C23T]
MPHQTKPTIEGGYRPRMRYVLSALVIAALTLSGAGMTTASAADTELITNGGFESGLTGWFANNGNGTDGGALAVVSDAYSGASAVQITGRTTTGSGPMQDLSGKVQSGQTYAVSARVKYENAASPATKQFFVTMHYGGGTYTNLATVTATRGQWALIQGNFTIPATQSTSTARIFVETPWTPAPGDAPTTHLMDFTVDDVSVTGVAPPPPPSKTIEVVGKEPGNHNPIVSHEFGADPYALTYDGRVYIYTTNDSQMWAPDAQGNVVENTYNIQTLNVWSSADLVNWTDHGDAMVAGPNGIATYAGYSWAPAAAWKTINGQDKFFLYFANSAGGVGVLTADSPVGPWTDPLGHMLVSGSTPGASDGQNWLFDPGVVVDDQGNGYLYFGGGAVERDPNNPKSTRVIRLGADMISTVGSAEVIDAPAVFEASHVFERGGKYYYSYSSNFSSGTTPRLPGYPADGVIAYMMADSPLGPWTPAQYKGEILANMYGFFGVGGNNHQSFFELGGKFYVAYHAQTLNKAVAGGDGSKIKGYRSTHVNEVSFNADGTIKPIQADYAGAAQIGTLDAYAGQVEAETLAYRKGVATSMLTDKTQAPRLSVTDIDTGDWTALSQVAFGAEGAATVSAKVKPLQAGGVIKVRDGGPTGTVLGTLAVTGSTGQWTDVTASLAGATGTKDVYFTFEGPTGDLFELDSWSFTANAPAALDVSATTAARCVAGKTVLTVTVANDDTVAFTAAVTTGYGAKTFDAVAPGKKVSQAFTTRAASIPAGTLTVQATGTVGGTPVTTPIDVAYPASHCG